MNFSQKLGVFCLVLISVIYVYLMYINPEGFNFNRPPEIPNEVITDKPSGGEVVAPIELEPIENNSSKSFKTIKIYITDSNGNLRSVNRKCDTEKEKSCFNYAIKSLISGPTEWEKSKGLSSEIPSNTKILSVREGGNNILIDLSSSFESGGGAESTYIRVHQLIKTVQANTKLPVYLYINGKQADVIGGEGMMIKQPLSERSLLND